MEVSKLISIILPIFLRYDFPPKLLKLVCDINDVHWSVGPISLVTRLGRLTYLINGSLLTNKFHSEHVFVKYLQHFQLVENDFLAKEFSWLWAKDDPVTFTFNRRIIK